MPDVKKVLGNPKITFVLGGQPLEKELSVPSWLKSLATPIFLPETFSELRLPK
jgi:hypothetical protein